MSTIEKRAIAKSKAIEGRVAQILNARELVINVGSEAGVAAGMKFAVMSRSATQIIDPDTNEVLDEIDREKVRVRATEVRPKIAICKTYVTRTIPGRSGYSGYTSALEGLGKIVSAFPRPEQKVLEDFESR